MTSPTHQNLVSRGQERIVQRPRAMPRYQSLRRAIEQTRTQITDYRTIVSRLQHQFDSIIRPLEESMTSRVLELTQKLIDHHDQTALSISDKSVLGLWIGDNLASLSQHPFAKAQAVQELALRWRNSLRAEASGATSLNTGGQSAAGGNDELANTFTQAAQDPADQSRPEGRHRQREKQDAESSADARTGYADDDDDEPAPATEPATRDKSRIETDALVAQLFRQLAAVLHPDREPDEALKQEKDALMSQCLQARQTGDLATLLSLHAEHVGGDELLSGSEMTYLIKSLERQLRALQLNLRQLRFGDTLQTMMIERYAGHSDRETADRFSRHARSLRQEVQRLEQLEVSVATIEGLDVALEKRRDELLDRMAINEMTGL